MPRTKTRYNMHMRRVLSVLTITCFILELSAYGIASAWTGPTAAPPGNNVAAPLNVSTNDQQKHGWIGLDWLSILRHITVTGSISDEPGIAYLNFDAVGNPDSIAWNGSGYGIRDNNGLLEFKNNGGSWQSIQAFVTTFCGGGACGGSGPWATSGTNIYNTNTGNVGIGTANPQAKLHIVGVETLRQQTDNAFQSFYNTAGAFEGYIKVINNQGFILNARQAVPMIFYTSDSERMRIAPSGNVGIGTTNPSARLDLGGGNIAMGYQVVTCVVGVPDGNFVSCACPAGKHALGGSCWEYSGGREAATTMDANSYYCAFESPYGTAQIQVSCANIQ
jgi:hypothetical protein